MAASNAGALRGSSQKPWKQKRKKAQLVDSIEIFEGKPTVPGPISLEITPADGNSYIRIVCQEDVEFFVPRKILEQLKCVDIILHGEVQFKERMENVIRFPEFRYEVLESLLRFVCIEFIDSLKSEQYWGENAPRVTFQFGVEPSQVMELVYASHFFGLKNLLSVAAAMMSVVLWELDRAAGKWKLLSSRRYEELYCTRWHEETCRLALFAHTMLVGSTLVLWQVFKRWSPYLGVYPPVAFNLEDSTWQVSARQDSATFRRVDTEVCYAFIPSFTTTEP